MPRSKQRTEMAHWHSESNQMHRSAWLLMLVCYFPLLYLACCCCQRNSLPAARKDRIVRPHLSTDGIRFITADNDSILEWRRCLQRDRETKRCSGASSPWVQAEPKTLGGWWRRYRIYPIYESRGSMGTCHLVCCTPRLPREQDMV